MRFEREQTEETMRRIVRFLLRYREKWAAAGLMLVLGAGSAAGAYFYVPKGVWPAEKEEPAMADGDVQQETETAAIAVLETTAAQEEWKPTPGELNLTHYFPEGADQSDKTKSLAGEAFKILMTHDEEWINGIYDFSDVTPAQMAARLGKPGSSVMGHFNPKDSRHDRSDPSTWTINTFKNIRMTAQDGDGTPITPYSNVLEIMSMANLYTYFKGAEDYDLFLSYSKELWELSHSYSVSMSEVYYCSGCMSEDAERREMEELEAAARAEALGLTEDAAVKDAEESAGTAEASESRAGETASREAGSESDGDTGSEPASSAAPVIIAGKSAAHKETEASSAAAKEAEETLAAAKEAEVTAALETPEAVPESTSRVIVSRRNLKETASETETSSADLENTSAAAENAPSQEKEGDPEHLSEATPADAESEGTGSQKDREALTDCPGHVDLIIHMKIIGLDEENNLFEKDTIGGDVANFEENGWQGWNQYTKASARLLSSQDWFEKYGLTVSSISSGNPLTEAEIEAYMVQLPADLSQTRKDIIRFALSSVGRVPYYWGGKPAVPNYGSNSFGVLTTPDYKGRVYKGLDCSGWINWVYWSATGRRLPYESTSGLAVTGTKIQRNELQPGDIIVRTGADAHVIMFLGWTADGKIRCIHESSAAVNNVTVAVRDANWPYYRKLAD